jgi:K+-sensing histidine kinase KdpD
MLEILRRFSPFPTVDAEGNLFDGLQLKQGSRCQKCKSRSCRVRLSESAPSGPSHDHCEHGLSTMLIQTPFGALLLNGLLVPFSNTRLTPKMKKILRAQKVTVEEVAAFAASVLASAPLIQKELDDGVQEALESLHDIKTGVSLVFRNAEAIVQSLQGVTDDERIEGADPAMKSLLKSVALLRSRLDMASIVANPEAAGYGQTRRQPVYKSVHRMVRMFEQEAQQRNIRLRMAGDSYNLLFVHDSFDTVPLVLLENAIKYSDPGSDVTVSVFDVGRSSCRVSIESHGELVPEADRDRIFERRFRSDKAKRLRSSGSGLGLYIASIVANAHGFQIQYEARADAARPSVGTNQFFFEVKSLIQ